MRLDQMIAKSAGQLEEAGIDTAKLDARLLASHAFGMSETDLIMNFDRALSSGEQDRLEGLVKRRLTREPIAHIMGEREFWGLPFKVTPDSLVPRSDSETLIAGVLECIKTPSDSLRIVDIGTGTGCLLLSLLSELPNAVGVGVDICSAALEVAQHNALALGLSDRCTFQSGDYARGLLGNIDVLISNPPYLASDEMSDLEDDVALYDPKGALVSGDTGLEAYEAIFCEVSRWDNKPALMAFEFGYRQAKAVRDLAFGFGLAEQSGNAARILHDLAGRDRVLLIDNQM